MAHGLEARVLLLRYSLGKRNALTIPFPWRPCKNKVPMFCHSDCGCCGVGLVDCRVKTG